MDSMLKDRGNLMTKSSRWWVWIVAVSLVSSFLTALPAVVRAPSAAAVGGYDNASIADTALPVSYTHLRTAARPWSSSE